MPDLMRSSPPNDLFSPASTPVRGPVESPSPSDTSTSDLAAAKAITHADITRNAIMDHLAARGPSTLFEVAARMGVPDHTISGRFTDLAKAGKIARTGNRRKKPSTGCQADVWTLLA